MSRDRLSWFLSMLNRKLAAADANLEEFSFLTLARIFEEIRDTMESLDQK